MCVKQRRRSATLQKTGRLRDQERPDPVVTFSPGQVLKVSDSMLSIHTLPPVMGKSQSRFDLNRDWIAPRDSIWPLRIRFGSLQFEIWFVWYFFGDSIQRLAIWDQIPWQQSIFAKFTFSASQRSSSEYNNGVSVATDHKWPTRNILEFCFVTWLSNSSSLGNEVPQHSSNFLPASNGSSVLQEQSSVLAATDCQHLLSKRSCCACRSEHVQGASESTCVLLG